MSVKTARILSSFKRGLLCKTNLNYSTKIHVHRIFKHEIVIPFSQYQSQLYFSDGPQKCWQCNHPFKSELFCSKCKALQKLPKDLNYFDIIGVKEDFDIIIEDIQKKYRHLQTLLHPDKFGQKTDKEKEISENLSSLVNKAYSTLLNPLNRGLYMLKLQNVSISEEITSSDPEFLMKIMDENEEVEEASEDKEKVLELLQKNRVKLASLTKQISEAFHNNDIEEAKKLLIKMKYYISIEDRLKKLKRDLGIVE